MSASGQIVYTSGTVRRLNWGEGCIRGGDGHSAGV